MTFERRQPSVDLRAFLDPLKPGEYFDCGGARLHGIDEALEAEALRRGRAVGDDHFQLVATDGGLIFCRASIMFAIAARWKDLTIGRPEEGAPSGEVILPINWPTHGDLRFTVSRRLGSNIFRRWLQLQAQATRRSQVEQDVRFERTTSSAAAPADGHSHGMVNGHRGDEPSSDGEPGRNGFSAPSDIEASDDAATLDLRGSVRSGTDSSHRPSGTSEIEPGHPDDSGDDEDGSQSTPPPILRLDESDRDAIRYATEQEQRRRRPPGDGDGGQGPSAGRSRPIVDPLATIDAAVVDEWVDDRVPHAAEARPVPAPGSPRPQSTIFGDEPTADPFNGHELGVDDGNGLLPEAGVNGATSRSDLRWPKDDGKESDSVGDAIRFEARPAASNSEPSLEAEDHDATATHFMRRTVDGTEIFLGGESAHNAEAFGRSAHRGDRHERGDRGNRAGATGRGRSRNGHDAVPVPEISGARLHLAESAESGAGPRLDIRSTLLAGRRESEWVEMLRQRQVLILGLVTVVALVLIALIGFLSGDRGEPIEWVAGSVAPATAGVGADTGATGIDAAAAAADEQTAGSSTTVVSPSGDAATIDSTAPTLRVSSTSVQICHSNYGGCVPVAADVDCEGDGDGPAFQATPVAVFGDDVYGLDTDDDREACEPDQPRLDASGGGG
ncbi:MAG: hypothetical protein OES24_19985 [Acidimicrobiia bacterium]|nr:hypothetical protein [Acidimicrobiia bacterium]